MFTFDAIPAHTAEAYRNGGPDANGLPVERTISNGDNNLCRHCLKRIPKGAEMLIFAYKPFTATHAYTEIGPVFICGEACLRHSGADLPEILTTAPEYLIKGYTADERVLYGTGAIVAQEDLAQGFERIFETPQVAFIHVRSARNNCFQVRVDRS